MRRVALFLLTDIAVVVELALGERLSGPAPATAAVRHLRAMQPQPSALRAFGIGGGRSIFGALFSSHPSIGHRIAALQLPSAAGRVPA